MPEDGQTTADPAAEKSPVASESGKSALPEQSEPARLGRVPHFELGPAGEVLRADAPAEMDAAPAPAAAVADYYVPAGRRTRVAPGSRRGSGWRGRLLPWLGLCLFAGCLYGLLRTAGPGGVPSTAAALQTPGFPINGAVDVVIDPGHGGQDSGAISQGVVEKDLNLDVGLRVAQVLRLAGWRVRLTREEDRYVPLETRVEIANALPGAIFVSIHFNDAQGQGSAVARASGIETYYSGAKLLPAPAPAIVWNALFHRDKPVPDAVTLDAVAAGALLADSIQQALIANTAAPDRGIKEAGLYVTRRVAGPAVLVEGGFVSHPQEAHLLQDPAYRQKIADSIAEGIVRFLDSARPAVPKNELPRA
jgi:N-acetylmuramoyl-L-alanine amidase